MKTKGSKNKKGVKRIINDGYIVIFNPEHPMAMKNGYVREHRMIAYDLGMLNDSSVEIHHINGVRTDNSAENLQMLTKKEHASITWKSKPRGNWDEERRKAKSIQMLGNQNWKGNIYENPELLGKEIS